MLDKRQVLQRRGTGIIPKVHIIGYTYYMVFFTGSIEQEQALRALLLHSKHDGLRDARMYIAH
jgi:hypothetical protein